MSTWRLRVKLFLERFWQPTSACMACMPGSVGNVLSAGHWEVALRTGLATGAIVLVLSFTPALAFFRNRYQNAVMVGCLTTLGDMLSHPNHYGLFHAEAFVTGLVSATLSLAAAYLLQRHAWRLRALRARLSSWVQPYRR
jgi:hypothetical protein